MLLLALGAALAAARPPAPFAHDSSAFTIALAPAESLRVTSVGPANGPVVVIIPGYLSPAFAFRHVLPPLAEAGVHAVVIEPLGVGLSSRPGKADYSQTAQAARIAMVLDTLHLTGAVVMAHSAGVPIALRLALARPDMVRRLLLVEEGPLESAAVPGVKQALRFAFVIKLFAGRGRLRKELRKGLIASSGDTTWVTDSVINAYTAGPAGDIGAVFRALKGMQNSVEPDSLRPQLHLLQMPVHLLLGGAPHRSGISCDMLSALQDDIPDFTMETIPGAGLHLHEEQPAVVVNELLGLMADERS